MRGVDDLLDARDPMAELRRLASDEPGAHGLLKLYERREELSERELCAMAIRYYSTELAHLREMVNRAAEVSGSSQWQYILGPSMVWRPR